MGKLVNYWCPVCRMAYSSLIRDLGDPCGDYSQGQPSPCPGWMLPWDEKLIPFFRPPLTSR